MAAGDIVKTHAFSVEEVDVYDSEDIVKGEVITDKRGYGFEQADAGDKGPFMVPIEDHDYTEETTHKIKAMFSGIVVVKKIATSAIPKGRAVMVSATAGSVKIWDGADIYTIVGIANELATYTATTVAIRVRC